MATYDDILGNGGGTPFPKGSKEWHEQQQDGSSVPPPVKGTQEWAEQKAATAPVVTALKPDITTTPPPPTKQEGSDGGALSYAELFKKLNPYTPPTDEELAKEKKKQKRDQIFAAIGDGISALSNLFFTTQYAPNMYTGKNTMSERTRVRYDRLMKEREGKEKEYYEGLMRAKIADDAKADGERKWQRQLGLDNYNRIRNDAKEERDRQMFELNLQLQGNKISASEAEAKRKGIEAKYAEELDNRIDNAGQQQRDVIDEFKAYLDDKKIEDDKEFLSKVQFLTNEIKISTDEKLKETLYIIADKIDKLNKTDAEKNSMLITSNFYVKLLLAGNIILSLLIMYLVF